MNERRAIEVNSVSKSRTKISDEAFERVATGLVEALERGTEAWPLPEPPMSDPDFPAIAPTSPHRLFEEGLGILNIDRGMFDRHLNTVVDLIVPHRMNLSDDPFEIHQKWLSRRMDDVCLLYTSPSPRDLARSRMPSSA